MGVQQQFWKCDRCAVRWYGRDDTCWVCARPGMPTRSIYSPPEVSPS